MNKKLTLFIIIFALILLWGCGGHIPEPQPEPEPPVIVEVEICTESGLLANKWCADARTVETQKYIEGEQPTTYCNIHKEPVYPEPIPIMGFQGVGGFNYFKITKDEFETRLLLQEIRLHGYYLNDGFMFLSDNRPEHANLTYHTPWRWDGKLFHLNEWNPIFWEDFKTYLELHKRVGLDFCAQPYMRKDYVNYPFENNANGITDFWGKERQQVGLLDEEVMRIHRAYYQKIMEIYQEVYGPDYKPYIKVSPNEVAHHGNGERLHRIMYFCEQMYEKVLYKYTDLEHIVVDVTGCEGAIGELKHRHRCPRPASCDRDGWHGKKGYDNFAIPERHGYSTWSDFAEISLKSPIPMKRLTEDGGGRTGDGNITIKKGVVVGDPEQQAYMMTELAKIYKETGKRFVFCSFPHEALKKVDGVFFPDYRVSEMPRVWECAKAMRKAYLEVMK